MRTRILVTDGINTIDVYWIEHTGSDLYFGFSKANGKRSYHASGKQHSTYGGTRDHEGVGLPLNEFKGILPLSNMRIGKLADQIKTRINSQRYSGKKSDNVLLLDARTAPRHAEGHVEIGLIEPTNLSMLNLRLKKHKISNLGEMIPQQVLLATSELPWIYVIGLWLIPDSPKVGEI
jgi:hypothetical protein